MYKYFIIVVMFISFPSKASSLNEVPGESTFYFFKDKQVEKLKKNFEEKPKDWYVTSLNYKKDSSNIVLPKSLPINQYIRNTKRYNKTITKRKKYIVKRKDTLYKIARIHKVDYKDIVGENRLKNSLIHKGQVLYIPYKKKQTFKKTTYRKKVFITPIKNHRISSYYGHRKDPFTGKKRSHLGLDLVSYFGAPIMAAASGKVIFSGIKGGYGKTVIIKHFNGYKTLYAHCAKLNVQKGDIVKAGDVIAALGRTGSSTGAHLHFEIFNKRGKRLNPLIQLRRTVPTKFRPKYINS